MKRMILVTLVLVVVFAGVLLINSLQSLGEVTARPERTLLPAPKGMSFYGGWLVDESYADDGLGAFNLPIGELCQVADYAGFQCNGNLADEVFWGFVLNSPAVRDVLHNARELMLSENPFPNDLQQENFSLVWREFVDGTRLSPYARVKLSLAWDSNVGECANFMPTIDTALRASCHYQAPQVFTACVHVDALGMASVSQSHIGEPSEDFDCN